MKRIVSILVFVGCAMMGFAQAGMAQTAQENTPVLDEAYLKYIEKYRRIALEQEQLHKIPACITLAQGLLESGAGKSELAVNAKNHFGIKCHSDWTGGTYSHDDETRQECFRKYNNARDSYEDHSRFLLRPRYASLFELPITDYKAWAHGLRRCGYATDPAYAAKLIKLIEDYGLAESGDANENGNGEPSAEVVAGATAGAAAAAEALVSDSTQTQDKKASTTTRKPTRKQRDVAKAEKEAAAKAAKAERERKKAEAKAAAAQKAKDAEQAAAAAATAAAAAEAEPDEESAAADVVSKAFSKEKKTGATMGVVELFSEHHVYRDKGVRWVVAVKGDTYEAIAYEFNIEPSRVLRYNHARKGAKPLDGQRVYLTKHK